jgi:DUF3048 family protein
MTRRQRMITISAAAGSAAVALAIGLIVALTGSSAPPSATSPTSPARLLSPFTGEPVTALGPVLAVKIDNIKQARPSTGLRSADIVYALPVEGGLSRLIAVFSSRVPPAIGPVRSAREDDLELLRQFGRPAFAYSGATPHLLPFVHRAPIVDLYAGLSSVASGYFRDPKRVAPHNLYARTAQLLADARGASDARDIGFRFGPLPAGGREVPSYSASYPAASFTFRWSAPAGRWLVWMDGAPAPATEGGQLGGATVIIQYTQITTSRFLEAGARPPYAVSTGSGRAVVLRNGQEFTVRWSRPSADGGTTFTLPDGKRMLFAPGQVWVVFAAATR